MAHNTQDVFKAIDQNSTADLEAILADDPGLVHARHANPDLFHWTTLQFAAARGKLEACRLLVEKGAEVYTNPMNTYPPVLQAVWMKHPEITEMLLVAGADIQVKDAAGKSAHDWARETKLPDICKILKAHLS